MEREAKIGVVNAQESAPKSREGKFKNTIAFLKEAIAEDAHLKKPDLTTEEAWVRQKNILGVYFGSPATFEDIGRMYGVTGEMVRYIKERGMRNLWGNCSSETQAAFPFQELALDKPRSQKSRERISRSLGGISISIRDKVVSGRSIQQIRKESEYQQVATARRTLKGWDIEVPYLINTLVQNVELENRLRSAVTDQEKQELLN